MITTIVSFIFLAATTFSPSANLSWPTVTVRGSQCSSEYEPGKEERRFRKLKRSTPIYVLYSSVFTTKLEFYVARVFHLFK